MLKTHWPGLLVLTLFLAACNGMEEQPRFDPFEASTFYDDGASARPLMPNTVARGQLDANSLLYEGTVDGAPATEFPFPVTEDVVKRGQERYNIFCTPCHGYVGNGDGIVVSRGLTPPPSFNTERLREVPVGYIFSVITNGFGAMYSYGARIPPDDRWAIIAYVRALQLSQNATMEDVPPDIQPTLEASTEVTTTEVLSDTFSEDELD